MVQLRLAASAADQEALIRSDRVPVYRRRAVVCEPVGVSIFDPEAEALAHRKARARAERRHAAKVARFAKILRALTARPSLVDGAELVEA